MPTEEDMYKAQLTFISILDENYEKLPISRKGSKFFCVFCFNFHSSRDHECNSLAISNEAEKTAGYWLCQLVGDAEKVDRGLMEKLKQSVITRIEEYEKHNNYDKKAKHSPKKRKIEDTTVTVDSSSITNRWVHTQIETSSSSSNKYSFGKRTDEPQSSADSPVEKSFDDGQFFSSTGRILRKTRYEAVAKSPIETNKTLSNANIREDFEERVAPVFPLDKRNWTRQHYIMHFHEVQYLSNRRNALFEDVNEKADQQNERKTRQT
ncbi:hypothetical protein CAEBREN_23090 [Caenorhabditis brenneri]|uniref:Uncharacterized protein n=1 Tax=Caenorhabditis brenneri TaxID=135651 RepID=G0N021_CAEBE|nr:hypothetical protein CAEBREN_23090 [Caenorhabditis brenneri]